ncbi:MAG: hypothetical protein ACI310_02625 [Bacilli bacterium]
MANDRELSDAERVWLITKVINAKGLYGLLDEIATEFKTTEIPGFARPLNDSKDSPKPISINNPEEKVAPMSVPSEASIYRESAKDLVELDRRDYPVVPEETKETTITPPVTDNLEEKPKVLERKPNNNPWTGIETVSPGQLKL